MDNKHSEQEAHPLENTMPLAPARNPYDGVPRDWKESGVPPSDEIIPSQVRTLISGRNSSQMNVDLYSNRSIKDCLPVEAWSFLG